MSSGCSGVQTHLWTLSRAPSLHLDPVAEVVSASRNAPDGENFDEPYEARLRRRYGSVTSDEWRWT
jgi:hypothetical protein